MPFSLSNISSSSRKKTSQTANSEPAKASEPIIIPMQYDLQIHTKNMENFSKIEKDISKINANISLMDRKLNIIDNYLKEKSKKLDPKKSNENETLIDTASNAVSGITNLFSSSPEKSQSNSTSEQAGGKKSRKSRTNKRKTQKNK
jgi:hypothetical protein